MPQHTQHPLIHVLLLWTTILSIAQVAFIIFFFTAGRYDLCQNSTTVPSEQTMQYKANSTTSFSNEQETQFGKGKMMVFQARNDTKDTTWVARNPDKDLILEGKVLKVMKDGYYFFNLCVTLLTCHKNQVVSLEWQNKILMQGVINVNSCSTGLIGKVGEFFAGGILKVIISPETEINTTDSSTYLDIIYMRKP